ncbi:hypothetical protein P153DRAFT_38937 [Dothidotthia symphoricarpi CBS 119687]|uniref:F-box domain-containing protein n=1 Tax=Dothidotthia symphoricarpi CBS 119687 TaxID=1392245 RepID=A0A6A6A9L2_9PLEO|nr:uncharacterized protein P153DRAFT_38937 [Dothidotthia symphoricarpi CBS 119687]KAF2128500.1 hypothetical protein P153DRAFT_38937 [Dothidotthia symphoricarpi CBS 119687]
MDLLSGLPEELIDGICAYLENEDLKKLRFCCKQIKVKSLHAFDNRFVGIVRCESLSLLAHCQRHVGNKNVEHRKVFWHQQQQLVIDEH